MDEQEPALPPEGVPAPEPTVQQLVARSFLRLPWGLGLPLVAIAAAAIVVGAAWVGWWFAIARLVEAALANPWLWLVNWFPILLAALLPIWAVMLVGPVLVAALQETDRQEERQQLSELDAWEVAIRSSDDPVDYAAYSRKALRAYYLMGQNQVNLSFYIGVAAMVFGFLFLVAGLCVQMLDPSKLPWLRQDVDVTFIAVGGGLIIEFVAATFIWVYRTAIVQLNVYYRRQALVHSALLAMAVAGKAGGDVQASVRRIVETLLTPPDEPVLPEAPDSRLGARALDTVLPGTGKGAGEGR
jgi:hypothetical protein